MHRMVGCIGMSEYTHTQTQKLGLRRVYVVAATYVSDGFIMK